MNRCAICGKFRRWSQLRFCWRMEMEDIYGHVGEYEWFECDACHTDTQETE